MSDVDQALPPKRRPTGRIVGRVIAGLLIAAGVALLVLPYDTMIDPFRDLGGTDSLPVTGPLEASCEAPILDGFHGEPDAWLNYAPDTGTSMGRNEKLTGSWCSPESIQRAGAGAVLILVGMSGLLVVSLIAHRARRRPDESDTDGPNVVA